MANRWVIDVPLETPSLNVWQRMHWAARSRLKKRWRDSVWAAWWNANARHEYPPRDRGRRRVTIYSRRFSKVRDFDRFIGGLVPLMDALVRAGAIVDDSDEWCEHGDHAQVVDRKNRGTRIVVEEMT